MKPLKAVYEAEPLPLVAGRPSAPAARATNLHMVSSPLAQVFSSFGYPLHTLQVNRTAPLAFCVESNESVYKGQPEQGFRIAWPCSLCGGPSKLWLQISKLMEALSDPGKPKGGGSLLADGSQRRLFGGVQIAF